MRDSKVKADTKLKPLSAGCDFLGYVIYPSHRVVRRRVIGHARQKLQIASGEALLSIWASYRGHFRHANSRRLLARFHAEFPHLKEIGS